MWTKTTKRERTMPRVNPIAITLLIGMGLIMLAISINGGEPWFGVGSLAITWGFAAFLYLGSRINDTVALIGDDVQDERHVYIHQRAAIYTLNILLFVIVGAAVVNVAQGGHGSPYTWLAAVGGATYLGFLVLLSRRG